MQIVRVWERKGRAKWYTAWVLHGVVACVWLNLSHGIELSGNRVDLYRSFVAFAEVFTRSIFFFGRSRDSSSFDKFMKKNYAQHPVKKWHN